MVKIAFYRGQGMIGNALIRFWTRSPYSHCELIVGDKWMSSSLMDGGVRAKTIIKDPAHWDVIDIPWASEEDVVHYFIQTKGNSYSWLDLIRAQVFNRTSNQNGADFCSEWCAAALGIPCPTTFSPKTLKVFVQYLNDFHQLAKQ